MNSEDFEFEVFHISVSPSACTFSIVSSQVRVQCRLVKRAIIETHSEGEAYD